MAMRSFDMTLFQRLMLTTVAAAALVSSLPAAAQTTPAGPPQATEVPADGPAATAVEGLQDIIVTAQRRAENIQRAPLAITAVNAEALRDQHITSPSDLTRIVPDTQVNSGGSAGDNGGAQSVFTIRGLGASGHGLLGSPAVAVHQDGHYLQTGLAQNQFFDVERVEVLPGPQGTLYGRSAAAGTVNILTNRPVDKVEGEVAVEGGGYGEFRGYGMINVPIDDTLAVRVAGQYQRHDGYFTNGYGDLHAGAVRGQLQWKPTDKFTARVVVQYFENSGKGATPVIVGPGAAALGLNGSPYSNSLAQYTYYNGVLSPTNTHVDVKKFTVYGDFAYDFGGATLTVAPTYEHFDNTNTNAPIGNPYSTYSTSGPANQKSVEVRLGDSGHTRLKWVIGGNYFQYGTTALITEHILPAGPFPQQVGPFFGVQAADAFDRLDKSDQRSKAVFAQATYPILDTLRLTLGARQNWDDSAYQGALGTTGIYVGASPNLLAAPLVTPILSSSAHFKKFTWKAAIDYDLGPRSLLYATVGRGYKPGGLNEGGPASSNTPASPLAPSQVFGAETVTHYEVGTKNRFFGNKLQVNDAVYYDDYLGYQNLTNEIVNPLAVGAIGAVVTNAGHARVYGNELSIDYQATPNDRLAVAVNYLNAKFKSYLLPAYVGAGGGVVAAQDFSGAQLPNAPHWSGTATYSHRVDLPGGSSVTGLVSSYLSTGYSSFLQGQAGTYQTSFTKTTLSLTFDNARHDFSVSAFVKNVENKATRLAGAYLQPFTYVFYDDPRTYGLTLSKRF